LVTKTIDQELKFVLNKINVGGELHESKLLELLLFSKLCEEMWSRYVNTVLHIETRWIFKAAC
jgi:hypothetical protein